ncbi:restriction endonuclease subunit S [Acinetobacter junii]|uniref:restriction endonuclease subunit S n=1 Tax=Acinetobacter junii TaxID=40215 RepID=UPI0024B698EA|nr:restriction endonuclease subunit S [Acinetobacter junii]MDI9719517.1 restriction endonuclease subunit S [Acinetobacter junii]
MEKHKCPEVRFNGFSEDWELSNFLDNIRSIIDFRGRTPKKLGMDWSKNGYLALSALNVKNGYIDPSIDAHYGDEKLYQKWMSGNELRKGQVLFTTEAPMGNVAQVPDETGYILSQRTIAFNTEKNKISDNFLAVLLGSPNVFNRLSELCSGGTAKGVSQKSLSTLEVIFPTELNEQECIGNFFQNLDQSIALHEKKLARTQNLKKAMLEKMFPKAESNKQPEIRLKGFSGDWEQRKLGDILKIKSGMSQKEIEVEKGRYPILATGGEIGRTDTPLYTKESVLIGRKGTIDKPYYMNSPFWTVDTLFYSEINESNFAYFIYVLFQKINWRNYNTSTGVPSLTSSTIHDIEVQIPGYHEQKTIAHFFRQLDETFVLQQQQLQTLKNLKQAFLEKMFV